MKTQAISLAVRLTAMIGMAIIVILLSFGWLVERSINQHFIEQDVGELNAVLQSIKHALITMPDQQAVTVQTVFANAIAGHHSAQYHISTAAGREIYSTLNTDFVRLLQTAPPVESINLDTVQSWQYQEHSYRGAVVQFNPEALSGLGDVESLRLIVVTGIDFHLYFLEDFHHYLWLLTVIACLVAILMTMLAVYQGHAPIRGMSREIAKISSDQLHVRLDESSVPAELVKLAQSFNGMLDRLEEGFKRLSDFSGDIAHELRTPITNMQTQTEVALSQARTVEQYREILYSSLEEYDRMAKMLKDMLFLAQADNKLLKPELTQVDIEAELLMQFDFFSAWAEEQGVGLTLHGKRVYLLGDRLMIRRALSNVLSNAIRHTPRGERVNVYIEYIAQSDSLSIRVQNPGDTIAAQHLPFLFERFYRPDSSRQRSGEGAGLGLAITKSIVEAHGGRITVHSRERLTTFELNIPMVQR
ncbi:MAG: heavy metal sensor histidine kinase [Alcaligenaceae bacterium]|nr:heavy metal sensor histidine kinase [Alcaligenaceae bacterium]